MSESALAQAVDLSADWLRQIEGGAVEARWGSLRKIAAELGVPLRELIEEGERLEPGAEGRKG
jgi:transcriptional regulator with XRE-family HTH domain